MANTVKTIIEDREGAYELFWNGKVYGSKVYLSLTRQRSGSTKKVTFDTATGRIDFGTSTLDTAKKALNKFSTMNVEPFSRFDFSDFASISSPEK